MQNKDFGKCDTCFRPAIGMFDIYSEGDNEDGSDDEMQTIAACEEHKPPNTYKDFHPEKDPFERFNKQLTLF